MALKLADFKNKADRNIISSLQQPITAEIKKEFDDYFNNQE